MTVLKSKPGKEADEQVEVAGPVLQNPPSSDQGAASQSDVAQGQGDAPGNAQGSASAPGSTPTQYDEIQNQLEKLRSTAEKNLRDVEEINSRDPVENLNEKIARLSSNYDIFDKAETNIKARYNDLTLQERKVIEDELWNINVLYIRKVQSMEDELKGLTNASQLDGTDSSSSSQPIKTTQPSILPSSDTGAESVQPTQLDEKVGPESRETTISPPSFKVGDTVEFTNNKKPKIGKITAINGDKYTINDNNIDYDVLKKNITTSPDTPSPHDEDVAKKRSGIKLDFSNPGPVATVSGPKVPDVFGDILEKGKKKKEEIDYLKREATSLIEFYQANNTRDNTKTLRNLNGIADINDNINESKLEEYKETIKLAIRVKNEIETELSKKSESSPLTLSQKSIDESDEDSIQSEDAAKFTPYIFLLDNDPATSLAIIRNKGDPNRISSLFYDLINKNIENATAQDKNDLTKLINYLGSVSKKETDLLQTDLQGKISSLKKVSSSPKATEVKKTPLLKIDQTASTDLDTKQPVEKVDQESDAQSSSPSTKDTTAQQIVPYGTPKVQSPQKELTESSEKKTDSSQEKSNDDNVTPANIGEKLEDILGFLNKYDTPMNSKLQNYYKSGNTDDETKLGESLKYQINKILTRSVPKFNPNNSGDYEKASHLYELAENLKHQETAKVIQQILKTSEIETSNNALDILDHLFPDIKKSTLSIENKLDLLIAFKKNANMFKVSNKNKDKKYYLKRVKEIFNMLFSKNHDPNQIIPGEDHKLFMNLMSNTTSVEKIEEIKNNLNTVSDDNSAFEVPVKSSPEKSPETASTKKSLWEKTKSLFTGKIGGSKTRKILKTK